MLLKIDTLKKEGKKIGFTCSSFDLLHAGHIAMLAESRANCDFLVVGLLSDPTNDRPETKNKPIQSLMERWIQLQSVGYIDLIIPFDSEKDLYNLLLLIQPDIRFVGEEYKGKNFTGCDLKNIEIFFNHREHSFSSSDLKKRIREFSIKEVSEEEKIKELEKCNIGLR